MSATKASARSLDDIQCDLDFARHERARAQSEILHAFRQGEGIPVALERECMNLDKEIAMLKDQMDAMSY